MHRTIKEPAEARITRKGSRFLTFAYPVGDEAIVEAILEEVRKRYHDATHHCYAYRLLTGEEVLAQASDAGEPAGSAGPPILRALESQDLINVFLVVVRYFGGTKLGIGGLIRAYGDAARAALAAAEVIEYTPKIQLRLSYPAELTSEVLRVVNRHRAEILAHKFADQPELIIELPAAKLEAFQRELSEATAGQGRVELSTHKA